MKHVAQCDNAATLVAIGPLFEVRLEPHPAVAAGLIASGRWPGPVVAKLMLDTGAETTVVEKRIAQGMGLTPVRFRPMVGVSQQPQMCPVYMMKIVLGVADEASKKTASIEYHSEVVGMDSPPTARAHVGLLGRDFLHGMHVIYNGPKGRVEIIVSSTVTRTLPDLRPRTGPWKAKRKAERAARKKNRKRR